VSREPGAQAGARFSPRPASTTQGTPHPATIVIAESGPIHRRRSFVDSRFRGRLVGAVAAAAPDAAEHGRPDAHLLLSSHPGIAISDYCSVTRLGCTLPPPQAGPGSRGRGRRMARPERSSRRERRTRTVSRFSRCPSWLVRDALGGPAMHRNTEGRRTILCALEANRAILTTRTQG